MLSSRMAVKPCGLVALRRRMERPVFPIACDERPGGCFKCAEKNFVCPGYDTSVDRFFRDETAAVEVKAKKAKTKAIIARDERDRVQLEKAALGKLKNAIEVPLLAPIIDHAITFFMQRYAMGLEEPPMNSKDFNQHLSTHGFHPIIATSMTALGLAGVASMYRDSTLKRECTKWYAKALKMTNDALRDPIEVKSDNTLLATMILGVYESTTNDKSLVAWAHHVTGASSLLQMRGKGQFSTPAGRRMWLQNIGLLTLQRLGIGEELPEFVHELGKEMQNWENKDDPGIRFYHLHIKVIDLRAQILNRRLTDLHAIVNIALELDGYATTVFEGVDEKWWSYEVRSCDPGTPGVFGTEYHLYPSLSAHQTWDWIRYNRIYLYDIIRNALIAGFATSPPVFSGPHYLQLLETSTQVIYRMQADIIATIPQYFQTLPTEHTTPSSPSECLPSRSVSPSSFALGTDLMKPVYPSPSNNTQTTPSPPPSIPARSATSSPFPSNPPKFMGSNFPASSTPLFTGNARDTSPTHRLPIVRVSGGFSSIWALYIAGATPIASPESQEYAINSLLKANSDFGINQAGVLAAALKIKIELDRRERECGGVPNADGSSSWNQWDGKWTRIVPMYMPMTGPHVDE
ncbi:unnamed protein product [Periconia digitata]|uniref:Uncharacterized protein n=1 Tax=Periconia digitata TaxID=1303443 RepID=A0A9W4XXI2_9PLEO|nr:unnamed protein product [Periconia digitata]